MLLRSSVILHTIASTMKPSSHPKDFTIFSRTKHRRQTDTNAMAKSTVVTMKIVMLLPSNSNDIAPVISRTGC